MLDVASEYGQPTDRQTKRIRTNITRTEHYIQFARKRLQLDDPFLVEQRQEVKNIAIIIYLRALGVGETIQNKIVRKATIVQYLDAVAKLFEEEGLGDPRIDKDTGKEHAFIGLILKEIERWENMPNRREPVTKTMVKHLQGSCKRHHKDHLDDALADWMIVGLHTGYRRIEWAQEKEPKTALDFQRADDPEKSIYAVTENDLIFRDKNNRVRHDPETMNPGEMGGIDLKWKFQKNRENGQVLTFAANHTDPSMCIVRAFVRIIQRARRWHVTKDTPLAIYQKSPKSRRRSYIVTASITRVFTRVAQEVYDFDPLKDKVSYTPHSLRVGATVLLHVAGFNGTTIKQRLRWKSNSFEMYLRNVPALASNQVQAMNEACVDMFVIPQ